MAEMEANLDVSREGLQGTIGSMRFEDAIDNGFEVGSFAPKYNCFVHKRSLSLPPVILLYAVRDLLLNGKLLS